MIEKINMINMITPMLATISEQLRKKDLINLILSCIDRWSLLSKAANGKLYEEEYSIFLILILLACKFNYDPYHNLCKIAARFLKYVRPFWDIMHYRVKLLKLVLFVPATNANSEQSFSALKRLKTKMRSTMHNRLNRLMVLHVYQDEAGKINIRKIVNEVISRKDSRKERFWFLQVL